VLATLACAGAICGQQRSVKIGFVGPLTGDQASIGLDELQAVHLAVDEANRKGDVIPGCRLEVVALDDQHTPAQAVAMAKRLAADRAVIAVIGHVNSSCTLAAAPVYQRARLVQISPSSTNPEISRKGFDTFFRTCATDDIQGPQAAEFAIRKLGARKVCVIDDKTTYGKEIADRFEVRAKELGASVLLHESIVQGEKDFSPLLTRIKALGPDLIFFGGMYPEGALLVRQAKGLGLKAKWLGPDGLYVPAFIDLAKDAAEGVCCTFVGADVSGVDSAREFLNAYTKKYGTIGPFAPHAYDAARIVIDAVRRAGKVDRKAVLEEVRRTNDFPGVLGRMGFDGNGDTTLRLISVFEVRNGRFRYLGPARQ